MGVDVKVNNNIESKENIFTIGNIVYDGDLVVIISSIEDEHDAFFGTILQHDDPSLWTIGKNYSLDCSDFKQFKGEIIIKVD